MATNLKNLSSYNPEDIPDAGNMSFGIVVSEWNADITNALAKGCIEALQTHGVSENRIDLMHVPGTFELPYGAKLLAQKDSYNAVIVLGCVIQGETRHFDYICQGVTQGVMDLNINLNIPVIFGVLTTENLQQAIDRAGGKHGNKGVEAAITAIKMAALR